MTQKRKKCTEEFRNAAVKLITEQGCQITEVTVIEKMQINEKLVDFHGADTRRIISKEKTYRSGN